MSSLSFQAKQESLKRKKQLRYKVFELKIDNHSIKENKEYFKMLFLEAKWLYNYLLSLENVIKVNSTNIKTVQVKLLDGTFEEREIRYLTALMKFSILEKLKDNIKSLSKAKKKGLKIGKLKFRKEIQTIILRDNLKFDKNKVFIPQKINNHKRLKPISVKVYGLKQLEGCLEMGQACLIRKSSGFYFHVITYWAKETFQHKEIVAIDFNCSNTMVLSNGQQINKITIKETKRLKKLQQKQARSVKGSKNRYKLNKKISKQYEINKNRKEDISNKIINKLKNFKVIIQNDNFRGWHSGGHAKSVQYSILGRIKTKLKSLETIKVIGQYERTTNTCSCCDERLYLKQEDRWFICPSCGYSQNRDLNATYNIMKIGLEQSKFKPLESCIDFSNIFGIKVKEIMKKENAIS